MPRNLVPALTLVETGKDRATIGPEVQPHRLAFAVSGCISLALPDLLKELKKGGYRVVHVVAAGERPKSLPEGWRG